MPPTLCDLKNHTVYDVVLGRSEAALENYLHQLAGKDLVRVVCIHLSATYRALVRKYLPDARIVADRFHVIRLINHHFVACWREIDPVGARSRGLLSLVRRHRHNLKPEQQLKLQAYLIRNFSNRWSKRQGWDTVMNQLAVMFVDRLKPELAAAV